MGTVLAGPRSADRISSTEGDFYARYEWCLNPVLSLSGLFQRLTEELNRYDDLPVGWQREESTINLYLFICAVACTVDDYLAWRPWKLPRVIARFPWLRRGAGLAEVLLNASWSAHRLVGDARVGRWRRQWGRCVDHVCGMLVRRELFGRERPEETNLLGELRAMVQRLTKPSLPQRLLKRRMILPEGFRCQDLTHYDVFSMAQSFADQQRSREDRLVVIGPRTAGAYFAPLTKAYLAARGWPWVSWMTIRPKMRLSRREWWELRLLTRGNAQILLIDDHPNTGKTFQSMLGVLRSLRVPSRRITILAPHHPAEGDWPLLKDSGVTVIRLVPKKFYKARLLDPGGAASRIRDYYANWDDVRIHENAEVDAVNIRLKDHYADGFHVRLKRLFRVELHSRTQPTTVRHLFVKSVGWGWLGYHAYIAAVRLADCVPPVVGLRDGLLCTEWIGDVSRSQTGLPLDQRVRTLSSYVVKRAQRLRLDGDPCFESTGPRWNAWDEIGTILRGVYGPYVGRLKGPALQHRLRRYACPVPTLVDGRMQPDEWIAAPTGIRKVDFEHHNFGGAEKDIVDPAWDLASAIFEFSLSEHEERDLLEAYAQESGDRTVFGRIPLYQLLYAVHKVNLARYAIAHGRGYLKLQDWNRLYLSARNFLVYRMNRLLAGPAGRLPWVSWSKRLFFLDVDGVLDYEKFGFPHTTPSGVAALALLRLNDVSVVLNTGRSVDHVRNYCKVHGLPGGIAEYGSVFVDAVSQCELPLVDPEAAEQLARCREAVNGIPGACVDDGYRYSVRMYRWHGSHTVGLDASEAQGLLTRCQANRLTVISRLGETLIVQRGISKGSALLAVKQHLGCITEPVVAIGDSDQDLDALEMAEFSYAPANCSRAVRELARRGHCRIMRQPFQRGLLAAVREVLSLRAPSNAGAPQFIPSEDSSDFIRALLQVSERPLLRQLVAGLNWRGL